MTCALDFQDCLYGAELVIDKVSPSLFLNFQGPRLVHALPLLVRTLHLGVRHRLLHHAALSRRRILQLPVARARQNLHHVCRGARVRRPAHTAGKY